MDYDELVAQVLELRRRDKRVAYRALKRRFDIDDGCLEDLKIDVIKARRLAIDEDGEILVWTGEGVPDESDPRQRAEVERQFYAWFRVVCGLLREQRRVTYRELKHLFGLDDVV